MKKSSLATNNTLSILLWLSVLSILSLPACNPDHGKKTALKAAKGEGDIVIGAVYPESEYGDQFIKGFKLAVKEINDSGGILDRDIRAIYRDDKFSVKKSKKIAREFAKNHDLIAVLGHNASEPAISASIIYENNEIVYISQRATSDHLTEHGFKFIFRNVTKNVDFAQTIVKFVEHDISKKSVLVIAINDAYGRDLSNEFQGLAKEAGIGIIGPITINPWEKDIKESFLRHANFIEEERFDDVFDSIFIAAANPFAAKLIKMIRELGVTGTIFGSEGFDSHDLIDIAGKAAESVIFCTVNRPNGEKYDKFAKNFRETYNMEPDGWAAITYDSVNLLAYCINKAGSSVPKIVADVMHFIQDWEGVTGLHTFDGSGELIVERPLDFKTVHNGKLEYLTDLE